MKPFESITNEKNNYFLSFDIFTFYSGDSGFYNGFGADRLFP